MIWQKSYLLITIAGSNRSVLRFPRANDAPHGFREKNVRVCAAALVYHQNMTRRSTISNCRSFLRNNTERKVMKVFQEGSPGAWRDWLLRYGKALVKNEQDVRVHTRFMSPCLGSVLRVSSDGMEMSVLVYRSPVCVMKFPVHNIFRLEVFNSRRLSCSDPQTQRMRNVREVEFPPIPIDDSCP